MRKAHRLSHSTQSSKPLYTNNEDICHSKRTLESIKKSKRPSFVDEKEHPSVNQRPNFANGFSLISLSDLVAFMPNAAMFANTLDIHSLYKLRLSRSSQKLENFFGESAPIDLCTHEIRKEGLKAILQSKVPLCYFLYFLLDEYNSENLFFFLQIEHFEQAFKSLPDNDQKTMAEVIFNRFIAKDSQFEINVDERVRQNIQNEISSTTIPDAHVFDEAKSVVYIFLEASFERFIHSSVFEDMVIHCGEHATHYNKNIIQTAVEYLLNCQKQHEQDDLSFLNSNIQVDNQFLLINKHHCTLVKSYIREFIESMFGAEYLEKCNTKNSATSKASSFSSSSSSTTTSNSSGSPKHYFLEKFKLIK